MAATMGDLFSAGNCTERVTGVIEHALELGVAVGEDAAQPPAGAAVEWPDDAGSERLPRPCAWARVRPRRKA
jgi:hypothetical protein